MKRSVNYGSVTMPVEEFQKMKFNEFPSADGMQFYFDYINKTMQNVKWVTDKKQPMKLKEK